MSKPYHVIGAVFSDTSFTNPAPETIETHGPFDDYDAAEAVWRGCAQSNVDNAHHRAFIVQTDYDSPLSVEYALGFLWMTGKLQSSEESSVHP
jgi:hypothetical protein